MTLKDAAKVMNQSNGNHLEKIYIPSLGRDVYFKPLSTADAKTLTRLSFIDEFDPNVQMMKLSLFNTLCTEDMTKIEVKDEEGHVYPPLTAENLTELDYLAFLCGIRQLLDLDVAYTFDCRNEECKNKWEHALKVSQLFKDQIQKFKRKTVFFEKEDERTGNIYKFELTDFNMVDWFYFRYMINKIKEKDPDSPQIIFEGKYVRPLLYIKNIWINDELIEDWNKSLITDKLEFYNQISPNITINPKGSSTETVYSIIQQNFIEEQIEKKMLNYTVTCPKCGTKYGGVFTLENFFIF